MTTPPDTMTVRVADRRHDPVGHAAIRTITISAHCPQCGGRRGAPYEHRFSDDGEWKTADRWDNPCGHTDMYEAVLVETIPLGCPDCRSPRVATLEQIPGRCLIGGIARHAAGTFLVDWADGTEVDWDNQRTVGATCRDCGWSYTGDDWAARLVPARAPEAADAAA